MTRCDSFFKSLPSPLAVVSLLQISLDTELISPSQTLGSLS
jgi:hypothetical protein